MHSRASEDLPDFFGSMLVKEMRQNLRRGSFIVPFLAVHVLAVAAILVEFQGGRVPSLSVPAGMLNLQILVDSGPLWWVIGAVCGVVMPAAGLILMGQELEEGNHELLLLTKLSRWSVVRGKFLSLWSLCVLTLSSLLPYVLVRYQVGAIELVDDLACTLTVLGWSAIFSAGAIGASSFKGLGARVMAMILFVGSSMASVFISLMLFLVEDEVGVMWNLNAVAGIFCFTTLGLALGRSRLRLVIHAFEVKPSYMVLGLLFFTPFVVGITTAMSIGYAGLVGLLAMAGVGIYADVTPKMPVGAAAPQPQIPGPTPGASKGTLGG
ncbi:ABC-type transport system involved in multi-copper enzyme maturation permease subunit [Haloferula luteola]|uniref:ABC-type transport system involved in multi-copper enzyme maturation permease subunit n=1 Tax=Haloferula luteola TaxID=595692 RepID=A0A840V8V0_9BACT|nr:hypothetical protein [Haloferula luteola]MBB5351148.1 ABC-type transport system involved in multi-copper enzyme maturation permease subunit [Haloferula luteola]